VNSLIRERELLLMAMRASNISAEERNAFRARLPALDKKLLAQLARFDPGPEKRSRLDDERDGDKRLVGLAASLWKQGFYDAAVAFSRFGLDPALTLDEAFSVAGPPGRRAQSATTKRDAAAVNMRAKGEKWSVITEALGISASDGKRLIDALRSINELRETPSSSTPKTKKELDRDRDFHRRALNAAPHLTWRTRLSLRRQG
jgi:hypothetical protein